MEFMGEEEEDDNAEEVRSVVAGGQYDRELHFLLLNSLRISFAQLLFSYSCSLAAPRRPAPQNTTMAIGDGERPWPLTWSGLLHLLLAFPYVVGAQRTAIDESVARLNSSWTTSPPQVGDPFGGWLLRPVLSRWTAVMPGIACGFFCTDNCTGMLFGVFAGDINYGGNRFPFNDGWFRSYGLHVLWSANRNRPVGENATLELSREGNLVLRDTDGAKVWSTGTSGKSVVGMNLSAEGNLVLFGGGVNEILWQSFDHPSDSWVMGQKLKAGTHLTAGYSAKNGFGQDEVYYSQSLMDTGLFAYLNSHPPVLYYKQERIFDVSYYEFVNGSIQGYLNDGRMTTILYFPTAYTFQYMRLESDGHLRLYELSNSSLIPVLDLFGGRLGVCDYPTVCGRYGICTNGACRCPEDLNSDVNYFRPSNYTDYTAGCLETHPLSCQDPRNHHFLRLQDISYSGYDLQSPRHVNIDEDSCKDACLKNCSCKASFFQYKMNSSMGDCYLTNQVYSMRSVQSDDDHRYGGLNGDETYQSVAFLKVQKEKTLSPTISRNKPRSRIILWGTLGALFAIFLMISLCIRYFILRNVKETKEEESDEDHLGQLSGMPKRFSFEDLRIATDNFSTKLGQGGFGSVFGGLLVDGTRVAVKRLDSVSQGMKEFLAEVQTIGSIHHANLVKLIGYCVEKSCKLLVYEFMCNGSLEKWIFQREQTFDLDWQTRQNIILDVAKALCYLHEDCRQRIVHLDIKPQNILLDIGFHAKVSDFGLAKLIDKDQSHVVTVMRGTPGYLAPEWLSNVITEKVDVYSYGVVILEVICGRKNLDKSLQEKGATLVILLKIKAEENRLSEMVDKNIKGIDDHIEEATRMLQIATCCLQNDHNKRPPMSIVVKAIEGGVDVESIQEYTSSAGGGESTNDFSTPLAASLLSGPR